MPGPSGVCRHKTLRHIAVWQRRKQNIKEDYNQKSYLSLLDLNVSLSLSLETEAGEARSQHHPRFTMQKFSSEELGSCLPKTREIKQRREKL